MTNENTENHSIPVRLTDILHFKSLSNLSLSLDGTRAAFMIHQCNGAQDGYNSNLWIYDLSRGRTVQVTSGNKKQIFCWTPDGSLVYATPDAETRFTKMNPEGSLSPAFNIPIQVKAIQPVTDALWLVEAASFVNEEAKGLLTEKICVVLEELPAHFNGVGYTSGSRNSLYLFNQFTGSLRQITPPRFETMGYTLCIKEQKIVCHGHEYTDVRGIRGSVYLYDIPAETGSIVVEPNIYRIYYAAMMGQNLLFVGTKGNHDSNENPTFYTLNLSSKEVSELCYPDHYIGGLGIGSDCRYGTGTTSLCSGDSIYFTSAHFESSHLFQVTSDGGFRQISRREGSIDCFDIKGDKAVFVGMRDMGLQELYTLNLVTGQETRLTNFNRDYTDSHKICPPVPCYFKNHDNITITGWVIPPANYDVNRTYPAILDIHGGPKACYGMVFYHEMQLWANEGYFVFFCNPRGSDGHGDAYSTISGINGTLDYDDLMQFTDHVLDIYPQIDRTRVGVTGGSYGGFLTNWIAGHTDRFAAAASQRSIGDWMVHYAACDSGFWVTSEQFPPSPLYDAKNAWEHSPGKYAMNIKTPMLFIHSDEDRRCPLSEMMPVYTGAMLAGIPVRMCLFHGENHELSRAGKPRCRMKRLAEITNWMDKYLKGERME